MFPLSFSVQHNLCLYTRPNPARSPPYEQSYSNIRQLSDLNQFRPSQKKRIGRVHTEYKLIQKRRQLICQVKRQGYYGLFRLDREKVKKRHSTHKSCPITPNNDRIFNFGEIVFFHNQSFKNVWSDIKPSGFIQNLQFLPTKHCHVWLLYNKIFSVVKQEILSLSIVIQFSLTITNFLAGAIKSPC